MSELAVQIANTEAFIAADPQLLTIYRPPAKVSDGAGGHRPGTSLPTVAQPKLYRLIPQGNTQGNVSGTQAQTFNGQLERPSFILMGSAGADLQKGDYFTWHGHTWELERVHDTPIYETKADVFIRVD